MFELMSVKLYFENNFKKTKLKVKITPHVIKMLEQTFNSNNFTKVYFETKHACIYWKYDLRLN